MAAELSDSMIARLTAESWRANMQQTTSERVN